MTDRPIELLLGDADPEVSEGQARSLLSGNRNPASGIGMFPDTGHGVFRDANVPLYRRTVTTFVRVVTAPTTKTY